MKLQGKTAVITGGGTGIGLAIAHALAAEGCRVAIAGRRAEPLEKAVAEFDNDPPLVCHTVDVARIESVAELFDWARGELGRIDILVNSAGINIVRRTMAETSPEDWDRVLAVNLSGAFYCMREVLPEMRERRDGLIVNISSIAGLRASMLGGTSYSASKFGMSALGTCVALEDGEHGVRVTNVYPGEVETPILEHRPNPVSAEHRARILQPEDVSAAGLMVACLPPRAHVSDLVVKPTSQPFA